MYAILLSTIYPILTHSVCPGLYDGTPPLNEAYTPDIDTYNEAVANLDIAAVFNDLNNLMHNSQECWPADTFGSESSYGPLFIRLTWHCAGTFRATDGLGGCAGGRQRFWPEASWDDNTNLDKARALLVPLKYKYGTALSWGDLMVFAGTAAILNMSGPVSEICAGRIDSPDGNDSLPLGPGPQAPPCDIPGDCQRPLGPDTIGLIYVNPEGFQGIPDQSKSATQIREIFGRMNMSDRETVALIGGGHAFGKCHGACPFGAGPPPHMDPFNPWPGNCSSGKGIDTFTSGIEGKWTSTPLKWSNEYFKLLININYELHKGPGNKYQWRHPKDTSLIMLTTDLALVNDSNYRIISKEFADNITALNVAFSNAWEKLVTSGGMWAQNKKCISSAELFGEEKEESQPETPTEKEKVTWMIVGIIFIILCVIVSCALVWTSDKILNSGKDKVYGGTSKQSDGKKYSQTAPEEENLTE
eukprot:70149_1